MDKFALVYEFNKDSPLMTYQAAKELDAGHYSKALELLEKAVEKFPSHLTANLLFSVALAQNGKIEEAKNNLIKCRDLNLDAETYDYYLQNIENIEREADGISFNLDDTVKEILNESFLETSEYDSEKELELIDDTFEEKSTKDNNISDENSIITETLAEIYASQENYEEALDVYHKLIRLKPEMEKKFNNRISEIKTAIENKKKKKIGN